MRINFRVNYLQTIKYPIYIITYNLNRIKCQYLIMIQIKLMNCIQYITYSKYPFSK